MTQMEALDELVCYLPDWDDKDRALRQVNNVLTDIGVRGFLKLVRDVHDALTEPSDFWGPMWEHSEDCIKSMGDHNGVPCSMLRASTVRAVTSLIEWLGIEVYVAEVERAKEALKARTTAKAQEGGR